MLPVKTAARFARVVSWIGHPLVFVTISVGIVVITQLTSSAAIPILAALFLSVIVPTAVLLVAGVRSGRWQDADVSVREERKRFYPWAIPFSTLGALVTWLIRAPFFVVRGGLVTLALFVAAAVVNFWLKISLHTLFASYCTMVLFRINALCGTVALILAGLVFWSRLFLSRHTLLEVVAGVGLGVSGGIIAAWWPL
jgi:membrane-associated phospholipid phosphatase